MSQVLRLSFLGVCLSGVVGIGATAQEVDVTGDWEITFESPRGAQTIPITFVQEGTTVTGTAETRTGTAEIQDGKVEGNSLTFKIVRIFGQRSMEQVYTATVTGDTMEGTITMTGGQGGGRGNRRGPLTFAAKRVEG